VDFAAKAGNAEWPAMLKMEAFKDVAKAKPAAK